MMTPDRQMTVIWTPLGTPMLSMRLSSARSTVGATRSMWSVERRTHALTTMAAAERVWAMTVPSAAPNTPMPSTATNSRARARLTIDAQMRITKGVRESPWARKTEAPML